MGERISFELSAEQLAMLDAIRGHRTRAVSAKALLVAVLEDDAAEHGWTTTPDDKIIIFMLIRFPHTNAETY